MDIKAELLSIAAPVTQMGSTSPGQRTLWDGARWGSPRAFTNASPGLDTGAGAEVCLTACLLPLSQNPLSSPFAPGLRGPGGVGGELSGATTPCPQWNRPQQRPGVALEAPGRRVPLPLPSTTRSLVGEPQSHSGKGFRARSSLGPHKAGSPPTPLQATSRSTV